MSAEGLVPTPPPQPAAAAAGGLRMPVAYAALVLIAFAAALWWPELRELAQRWNDSDGESHGWLVALLVPVLVWLQRDRLESGGGGWLLAVAGFAIAVIAYAVARAASVDTVAWTVIPFTVWFALWIAFGWRGARMLAFPVGYFLFAVPLWGLLTPFFQWLTVQACTLLLAVFGLQAYIVDEFVTVPAGTFEIAGGCSGINYVVVALATSTLLAFVERLDLRRTAWLVAVALGVAVLANWVRVTVIIIVGNATDMQSSLVENHATFGWWVFAFAMLPYFWYARRVAHARPAPARGTADPQKPAAAWALGALALAVAPLWAFAIDRPAAAAPSLTMPVAGAGWVGPEGPPLDWEPAFPGAADEVFAAWRRGPQVVELYAAVYDRQSPGRKLIGYFSSVAGTGWDERDLGATAVPGTGEAVLERRLAPEHGGAERLVWSWYEIRGQRTTSGLRVKLLEGLHAFGAPRRSAVVAMAARCVPDCAAARATLASAHAAGLGRWSTAAD